MEIINLDTTNPIGFYFSFKKFHPLMFYSTYGRIWLQYNGYPLLWYLISMILLLIIITGDMDTNHFIVYNIIDVDI